MSHQGKGRSAGGHRGHAHRKHACTVHRGLDQQPERVRTQLSMDLLNAQHNKIYPGWPVPQAQLPPRKPQLAQPWRAGLTGPCAHWLQLELSRSGQLAGLAAF